MERILVITALLVLIMIIVAKLNDSLKRKETFTDNRAQETVDSISVYLINLDISRDRLEFMNEQCKREKIEYARFPAVNGKELDISSMDNVTNKKMTRGAVGCTLSHIGIWEDAERKGHENIMVLEDDVVLAKNFKAKLAKILSEVPDDFDILYLGGSNLKVKRVSPNIGVPKKTKAKGTFNTGTYAMVINKKALPVLLRENRVISDNIDQKIKNNLFGKLKCYYVLPPLVTHNNEMPSMRRINSNQKPLTSWFSKVQNRISIENFTNT